MSFKRKVFSGIREFLDDLKNNLLPSGAVVWFDRTTAPTGWVICNGQTYTDSAGNTKTAPDLIGRYPLGAISDIGSTVEAGLPNITGTAWGYEIGKAGRWQTTGCFYDAGAGDQKGTSDNRDTCAKLGFSANRSSSIYGNSNTVTPPSTKLLPCVKK